MSHRTGRVKSQSWLIQSMVFKCPWTLDVLWGLQGKGRSIEGGSSRGQGQSLLLLLLITVITIIIIILLENFHWCLALNKAHVLWFREGRTRHILIRSYFHAALSKAWPTQALRGTCGMMESAAWARDGVDEREAGEVTHNQS